MNDLPKVKDRSHGYYRRFIMIPFKRIFKEHEQDRELDNKLLAELDGILQFALEGLKRLATRGKFSEPKSCNELMKQYIKESNPVNQFFEECIEEEQNAYIASKDMYILYRKFSIENGNMPLCNSNFGKEIQKKYGNIRRHITIDGERKWVYSGLKSI